MIQQEISILFRITYTDQQKSLNDKFWFMKLGIWGESSIKRRHRE